MKILVVDDDRIDREMAARCLRDMGGLEIAGVGDAEEALAAMPDEQPDVVLTDLRMPGMSGLELVEKLTADYPMVPVILMTSRGNEQIAVEALRAGAASYVPKRDLEHGLADTVEQILTVVEARRSRREILRFMTACETSFELVNDPTLITPLANYVEENLALLDFGNDAMRSQVGVCLMEALANAMLHGNLELDAALRREDRDAFDRQASERQKIEPYASRRVRCEARESPVRVEYTIADEGIGFDYSALPDPTDPANLLVVGGRGIMLMRTLMDEVTFHEGGSRVTLVKHAREA